jgi:hypothetical protein
MKRMIVGILFLALGVALVAGAQQKAQKKSQPKAPDNVQGTVILIAKNQSQITVRTSTGVDRIVIYRADTKWGVGTSKKNTPTSPDQLKQGYFLNCNGVFKGADLAATACYFREKQ